MVNLLLGGQTHWCVIEVFDRGCDKVPDLFIYQTIFCLAAYNVFTGSTGAETSWKVCLTCAYGRSDRVILYLAPTRQPDGLTLVKVLVAALRC